MTQSELLSSSLTMSSYGSAFWIFVSDLVLYAGGVVHKNFVQSMIECFSTQPHSIILDRLCQFIQPGQSLMRPTTSTSSSASLTCWRLKRKWVYCGHCVQKRLLSIHKGNYKAFSQITTCTVTCSISSFVSIPDFCAHYGKFDAWWQTYHSTNTHELTSLILLVYSTCHCGAKMINTTSKKASSLIDSTWHSNTTSSVLQ